MGKLPRKLEKYLAKIPEEERENRVALFESLKVRAEEYKFQSPAFWAMRQVVSERSESEIEKRMQKRLKKADRQK